jgi:HD-like signal output (HDOD) protein
VTLPAEHAHGRGIEHLLARIGAKGELPAAARIVQRLYATVSSDTCSTLEVARVILFDAGLSAKILRIVNSVNYAQRSRPVSTISRAVVLLGFEAIRDLATGVVVLEAIARDAKSRESVGRHVLRSFRCGLLAQALAREVRYPQMEEAYLLGLFADLGTLCLASYCPDEYEQAAERASARSMPLGDALIDTFGVQPAEVAAAMFDQWGFPSQYTSYFRRVPGERQAVSPGGKLLALVELADDYTAAVDAGHGAEQAAGADLAARFASLFGLPAERFAAAVAEANESLRTQGAALGIAATPIGDVAAESQSNGASASRPPVPGAGGIDGAALDMITEITRSVLERENINTTLAMIVEGVARTGGFDTVFLAVLNVRKDHLTGRLGFGDDIRERLAALSEPVREGAGILSETVLTRAPKLVPCGTPAPNMPRCSWVTYPIIVREKAIGVLAAGRTAEPPISERELPIMHLFGNQAALALDRAAG